MPWQKEVVGAVTKQHLLTCTVRPPSEVTATLETVAMAETPTVPAEELPQAAAVEAVEVEVE
jgi:hypothetical protein